MLALDFRERRHVLRQDFDLRERSRGGGFPFAPAGDREAALQDGAGADLHGEIHLYKRKLPPEPMDRAQPAIKMRALRMPTKWVQRQALQPGQDRVQGRAELFVGLTAVQGVAH